MSGGIYKKYLVSKVNGEPVDPEAHYFVLRLDKDPAARAAARTYAMIVRDTNHELYDDLLDEIAVFGMKDTEKVRTLEQEVMTGTVSYKEQQNWKSMYEQVQAENVTLRRERRGLYEMVEIAEGAAVQYVGVYVLGWKPEWGTPKVGFVEVE